MHHSFSSDSLRTHRAAILLASGVLAIAVPRLMWAASAGPTSGNVDPASKEDAAVDAMVGKSVESDYTAKHFSLVSGAVILNPFTIKADSSSSTGFVLEKESSTSAHAFIEGGFRYRWAWLDRLAPADKCKVESVATEKAKAELRVEEAQLYSASIGGTQTEIDAAKLKVTAAQQKVAAEKSQDAASAEATDCKEQRAWEAAQQEPPYFSLPTMWRRRGAMVLMPSDWTTRMGFAFADSSNTGAAGIAGSSDFYGELTPGWNLVNWSMHTSTAEKTPPSAHHSTSSRR